MNGRAPQIYHAITAAPAYRTKSFEELRLEDYQQGNKGRGGAAPVGNYGAATSPFGLAAPAPAPAYGATAFGAPAPAPGAFGAFGSPAPAPAPFGQAASAFGAAPAPAAGLFGAAAPAPAPGLFGAAAAPATSLFGAPAPAPGGLFGAQAPKPAGLFGAAPAAAPFGAAAPAFGAPAPAPFGAYRFPRRNHIESCASPRNIHVAPRGGAAIRQRARLSAERGTDARRD